jgi:hypothetical protein
VEGATRFLNVTEISLSLAQTTVGYCMGCSETVQTEWNMGAATFLHISQYSHSYATHIRSEVFAALIG